MLLHARVSLRHVGGVLLAAACLAVTACGSGDDGAGAGATAKGPPGSPSNPLAAQPEESSTPSGKPGFDALLEQQREAPRGKDPANVCALVTKAQAERISAAPLRDPFLAPQGPTCIYRFRDGASFATVAVEPVRIAALRRQMQDARPVGVSRRDGYCGTHGRPVLYLPLARSRVLSIAADCDDAVRLARLAIPQLDR